MNITDVQVNLVNAKDDKLRAFCTITFNDEFVIRDIKVIEGTKGPFVAMPSRKVMDHCPKCHGKNHLRAKFCNNCGNRLDPNRGRRDRGMLVRLHTDIAHPINSDCRERVQDRIIEDYEKAMQGARESGRRPIDFDGDFDSDFGKSGDFGKSDAVPRGDSAVRGEGPSKSVDLPSDHFAGTEKPMAADSPFEKKYDDKTELRGTMETRFPPGTDGGRDAFDSRNIS
jgi:stage V sporulation protein G